MKETGRVYPIELFLHLFQIYIMDYWPNAVFEIHIENGSNMITLAQDKETLDLVMLNHEFDFEKAFVIEMNYEKGLKFAWNSEKVASMLEDIQQNINQMLDRYPEFWDAFKDMVVEEEAIHDICHMAIEIDKSNIPSVFKPVTMLKTLGSYNNRVSNNKIAEC